LLKREKSLTSAAMITELWEEAWGDPAKHAKLCVDDGRTDECKAVIEDANALIADAAPALPSASETSATAATTHSITCFKLLGFESEGEMRKAPWLKPANTPVRVLS
jgi:hypothetical protein